MFIIVAFQYFPVQMTSTETAGEEKRIDLPEIRRKINAGELPHEIFGSQQFFELEKERIFKRAWIPLGHESEIPEPGDYVTRYICDDSLIAVRDEDDNVRVFFNTCCHQGMKVCQTEMGNASHFRCTYHGWTYSNSGDLVGVPFKHVSYEDQDDLSDLRLNEPRYDTYKGLIFACLDPDAEPLEEFLGGFTFYLDFYVGRSPEGMEVFGPQRRVINANWKLASMNTMSDHHHAATTHRSAAEVELAPEGLGGEIDDPRWHVAAGAGGLMMKRSTFFRDHPLRDSIKEAFSEEQWELVGDEEHPMDGNGSLLPLTNFLSYRIRLNEEGETVPITYMRIQRPLGPDETEVYTWALVEKDAPDEFKKKARQGYTMGWGISGMVEQDDLGNWSSVTEAGKGIATSKKDLKIDMKMEDEEADWPYPGRAYKAPFHEVNMRHFYNWVLDYLEDE